MHDFEAATSPQCLQDAVLRSRPGAQGDSSVRRAADRARANGTAARAASPPIHLADAEALTVEDVGSAVRPALGSRFADSSRARPGG